MRPQPDLTCNPDVCLEGLRKATKHLPQNRYYPSQDLNPEFPVYRSERNVSYYVDVCTVLIPHMWYIRETFI
jgi:hypothetical protein